MTALEDDDPGVRLSALAAMYHMEWESDPGESGSYALAVILAYLESDDAEMRMAAARALMAFRDDHRAEDALDRVIDWDLDERVRSVAMDVWRSIVGVEQTPCRGPAPSKD